MILRAEAATPDNVAPFGFWVGPEAPVPIARSKFYGDAVVLRKPAAFVGDDTLDISVATLDRRPLRIGWMERHFLHTQTFIPLGGKPFLMVLAPPGEAEMPDLSAARALVFNGSAGIALRLGTWHEFPLALVDETSIVILIRRDTVRDLQTVVGNEACGPDLDKKDILARTGLTLTVELGDSFAA